MKEYYIRFHKVDPKNEFFKRISEEAKNVFHGKKCVTCQELLPTSKFKITHEFLRHYGNGRNTIEEKPVIITYFGAVEKFDITSQEHSSDFDFYNSESLVDEFLLNVKSRIKGSNVDSFTRCGFSLENFQLLPTDNKQPLKNSWYWLTEPKSFETKSFNDLVFFSIRESILKRVINNGMTSSSWHFNRFLYNTMDQFIR